MDLTRLAIRTTLRKALIFALAFGFVAQPLAPIAAHAQAVNLAPSTPSIQGAASGTATTQYTFTAQSTDPEGDQIDYGFDWDNDGTVDGYTGYVNSGASAQLAHAWTSPGSYAFTVVAKDSNGNYSDQAQYSVSISSGVQDPANTSCGSWDGKSVSASTLWKQSGNIRYYIGTSGAAADTISCIGLWDENAGTWTASRLCKYADERECQTTATLGGSSQPLYYPSCPSGYQPSGDGCVPGCDAPNYLDNGYCVGGPSAPANNTGSSNTGNANTAPNAPVVLGLATAETGVSQTYTATAVDPQGDNVEYGFDWDNDGIIDGYTSPVASGTAGTMSHSWAAAGSYAFTVVARDPSGAISDSTSFFVTVQNPSNNNNNNNSQNNAPSDPVVTFAGNAAGSSIMFTAQSTDPEGDQIDYGFDWDNDGTVDGYTGYVNSGASAQLAHTFASAGTYAVGVVAKDALNHVSGITAVTVNVVSSGGGGSVNSAPNAPVVLGPTQGTVNQSYDFTAVATDPEGDDVKYGFDWDNDGVVDFYTSTVASGIAELGSHAWTTSGTKTFTVVAVDSSNNVSSATSYTIDIAASGGNNGGGNGGNNGGNGGNGGNNGGGSNPTGSFTVSPTSGLTTSENGATAAFTVVLNSAPLADVTFPVTSSDFSEGTTSPITSLMFTPSNWNVSQTVIVTGIDDTAVDGDVAYTVTVGPSTSADINWNGISAQSVSLTNIDNDSSSNGGGNGNGGGSTSSGGGSGRSGGPCIGYGCPTSSSGGGTPSIPGDVWILIDGTSNTGSGSSAQPTGPEQICPRDNFIQSFLRAGIDNNPNEVRKLQYFLNTYESANLAINGEFDAATENAVKALQSAHSAEILAPWGVTEPTGIVYITTSRYINTVFCRDNPNYAGNQDIKDILDNNVLYPTTTNPSDFQGVVGQATTTPRNLSNIAGVIGAISERVLNALKDIPWYQFLILVLILVGGGYILTGAFKKSLNSKDLYLHLIRGASILAIGTVLNVLNTLSFILSPSWFQDKIGLTLSWLLALDAINLLAIIVICLGVLIALYKRISSLEGKI